MKTGKKKMAKNMRIDVVKVQMVRDGSVVTPNQA